jgi:ribonuclease P protein component
VVARAYRLREEADVRRVRSRGKAFAHGPLVARVLPNDLQPVQNRYTVIAGKKCGNAVERNRLKRLTREALRGFHPHLQPGHDIALVVRGNRVELPTLDVAQDTLLRIFRRANLFVPGADVPEVGTPITAAWRTAPETGNEVPS